MVKTMKKNFQKVFFPITTEFIVQFPSNIFLSYLFILKGTTASRVFIIGVINFLIQKFIEVKLFIIAEFVNSEFIIMFMDAIMAMIIFKVENFARVATPIMINQFIILIKLLILTLIMINLIIKRFLGSIVIII